MFYIELDECVCVKGNQSEVILQHSGSVVYNINHLHFSRGEDSYFPPAICSAGGGHEEETLSSESISFMSDTHAWLHFFFFSLCATVAPVAVKLAISRSRALR